ncbi:hypothetical protein EV201_0590 [Ancylomarina subtilis]|uniref:Signal transduction histidine kinase internal region domain-containing protein n=1 Tax=Ancylomarina subtilis TaxID=1639035 RepID=A0A4Q7VII8_9BACT|nr:hypothetical protein EV201_0590 [Ancylomarina subtilis]
MKYFGIGFVCYMTYINLFGISIALIFDTFSQNFASNLQIFHSLIDQIIDFLIFGGFSLAYFYFIENRDYKQKMNEYDISIAKSKIQQLKAQLNPHFLFNNLNILDQLIEENQEKASDFLAQFSELYRYALNSSDKELISLKDELAFSQNYFEMMNRKYPDCYQLHIDDAIWNTDAIVPPFCLQVLIENAIVHNLGIEENPVNIHISNHNGIRVSNTKIATRKKNKGNGLALKNLSEQFLLLSNIPVAISEDNSYFAVTLPLIKLNKHD